VFSGALCMQAAISMVCTASSISACVSVDGWQISCMLAERAEQQWLCVQHGLWSDVKLGLQWCDSQLSDAVGGGMCCVGL
jgi:hypothetical protein